MDLFVIDVATTGGLTFKTSPTACIIITLVSGISMKFRRGGTHGNFIIPFRDSSLVSKDTLGHGSILIPSRSFFSFNEYYKNTIDFQEACCGSVGLCNLFYQQRIPTKCSFYRRPYSGNSIQLKRISYILILFPPLAWLLGDPHINTMDGANYTFNGWGEYAVFNLGDDFILQGRTTAVNVSDPGSPTQYSAFAFGMPNVTLEVSNKDY